MIEFKEVNLPEDFVSLLKGNMNFTIDSVGNVKGLILTKPNLKILVEKSFVDIDSKKRVEIILNSLGWIGLRDRLASLYLLKFETNRFPQASNLRLVRDIEEFENKVQPYAVDGFSRSFMLAFYFKICQVVIRQKEGDEVASFDYWISDRVLKLLAYTKSKTIKVDWLLLILMHFDAYLGFDRLKSHFESSSIDYASLYKQLDDEQKKQMVSNLLAYAYSIDDLDTVAPNLV